MDTPKVPKSSCINSSCFWSARAALTAFQVLVPGLGTVALEIESSKVKKVLDGTGKTGNPMVRTRIAHMLGIAVLCVIGYLLLHGKKLNTLDSVLVALTIAIMFVDVIYNAMRFTCNSDDADRDRAALQKK